LYTYYASGDTEDAKTIVGHFDYEAVKGSAYNYAASIDTAASPAGTAATASTLLDSAGTPVDISYTEEDIVFQLQVKNDDAAATPVYDAMWVLARPSLDTTNYNHATTPLAASDLTYAWAGYDNTNGYAVDMTPTADYELVADLLTGTCTEALWKFDVNNLPACTEAWNIGNTGISCVKV